MKIVFAGTRGYIESRNRRHFMHTSLDVSYLSDTVRIDCGADWLEQTDSIRAAAIAITHAHPDHAEGLKNGAPCPVYATEDAWETMASYPIEERRKVNLREPFQIGKIRFEAFPVIHSTRAPAVGYRVAAGRVSIFYVPDVVYIENRQDALSGVHLYIGDGATLTQSFVRKVGGSLIGHAPVQTQLTWCRKEGVPRAVITHCGSEIVEGDERTLGAKLRKMAEERNVEAQIAYDGMEMVLRR